MNAKSIALSVAAFATALTLQAQTKIHISDSKANGQIIPKEIYGQFSEHLGRCIYDGIWVGPESPIPNKDGYRTDVLNALKEISVPVLRWPGGCFADDYHWEDGVGPKEERAKISNNNWGGTMEDNSFGTNEFLNFCELLGCQPYISGNVGSGSPKELAKWVEYMTSDSQSTTANWRRANGREKPWDVKYLGIGNEAWGCGGSMTPEWYSNLFKQFTTYTRNYNPDHGLYKVASGANAEDYNWTEVCMQNIGDRMNAIAVHYYTWGSGEHATEFDGPLYYKTLVRAYGIEDCIKKHIAIMDKYDPDKKVDLFVDEWGCWWPVEEGTNPGHLFQQSTMRDAIVAAMTFNIFHKYTDRLKMCNIAQVVNVLQSMVLTKGDQMVLTPTWYAFKMYKPHQDAEYIPVEYPCEMIDAENGKIPSLSATASRKDGVITATVVNICYDKAQKVMLDWDTIGAKKAAVTGEILTSDKITDFNDFGKPEKVATKEFKNFKVTKEGITFEIPANSIVSLSIR